MDLSMFEDLPDVQEFLSGKNVRDSVSDIIDSIGRDKMSGKTPASPDKDTAVQSGRFPKNTPIAMAYVPKQEWDKTYTGENGLKKGTIFPELDLPFAPKEGCYDTER